MFDSVGIIIFYLLGFLDGPVKVLLALLYPVGCAVGRQHLPFLCSKASCDTKWIFLPDDQGQNNLFLNFPTCRKQCLLCFGFPGFCDLALNLDFTAKRFYI